jgi:hypothetical protein
VPYPHETQRLLKKETVAARVRAGSGSGAGVTSELGVVEALRDSEDACRERLASSPMSLKGSV